MCKSKTVWKFSILLRFTQWIMQVWTSLHTSLSDQVVSCCVCEITIKLWVVSSGNILNLFDSWAYPVVHLLLLKSPLVSRYIWQLIRWSCFSLFETFEKNEYNQKEVGMTHFKRQVAAASNCQSPRQSKVLDIIPNWIY